MSSERTVRPNLFLSHACEDKDDFVRPLAEALRQEFDVWYDEYALRIGDSLLEKISAGLRNCDRGIVVLSRNFFGKQWTQMELNGLVALETNERKILIPIWLGITKQDVLNFSPILADRLAIKAPDEIPSIVSQVRGAVLGETQTREILGNTVSQRFRRLGNFVALRARQEEVGHSPEGYRLVKDDVKAIFDYFERKADELQQHLTISRARDEGHMDAGLLKVVPPYATVQGPRCSKLRLELKENSPGRASACRLRVLFYRAQTPGYFQARVKEAEFRSWEKNAREPEADEVEFRPEFTERGAVDWKACDAKSGGRAVVFINDSGRVQTGERIVEDAFVRFADILEDELRGRRFTPCSKADLKRIYSLTE